MLKKTLAPVVACVFLLGGLALLWQPAAEADGFSAGLACEPTGSGAWCEASPQGQGYTYAFNTTGNLALHEGDPISPLRMVCCYGGGSGGYVIVEVTDADGCSSTAQRWVLCGGAG